MKFDPTLDYSKSDLSVSNNLALWKFGELIKTIVTLSIEANEQIAIMGYGCVTEEMSDDFDTYFTLSLQLYLDNNLLTLEQMGKLKRIAAFFDDHSFDKFPNFWDDNKLEVSPEWQSVRQQAKEILTLLNMDNLTIELHREEKYKTTDKGQQLIMQVTKTRLVRRNAS